jgi:single-strand DNA-binding protein
VKGRRISVEGRIQVRSYDAQDGSKRYVTEIVANEVEFLDSKGSAPQAGGFGAPAPAAPQSAPVDGFGPSIPDEEIPF